MTQIAIIGNTDWQNKRKVQQTLQELKKRFKVALSTEKPPHKKVTILSPMTGNAVKKFVITVAAQKLI